jgi:hypothetical protein
VAPTASAERILADSEKVVSYKEFSEAFEGAISGWIRVVDTRKDAVVLAAPVRATETEKAQWPGKSVSVRSHEDPWTRQRVSGILVDPRVFKRTRFDEQRRESRKRLVGNLMREFAEESSRRILEVIDTEIPLPEPEDLQILYDPV